LASHIRNRAHEAVAASLAEARETAKLTQRALAAELPAWLGWDHVTVAKAETNRRRITLPEVREYARVCGTDIAAINRRAAEIQSALTHVPRRKR
jgi:Helix-turn-helix